MAVVPDKNVTIDGDIYILYSLEANHAIMNQRLNNTWSGLSISYGYPMYEENTYTIFMTHDEKETRVKH